MASSGSTSPGWATSGRSAPPPVSPLGDRRRSDDRASVEDRQRGSVRVSPRAAGYTPRVTVPVESDRLPAPGAPPLVRVRRATPSHAPAIRAIADAAWRDTYRDLLRPETIDWFLDRAYSEDRVALRIERHETWVAELDDVVGAFAESAIEPNRVTLVAIYADPGQRGLGLGSALLHAITGAHPGVPVARTSCWATCWARPSTRRGASRPRRTSTRSWAASTSASAAGGCARAAEPRTPACAGERAVSSRAPRRSRQRFAIVLTIERKTSMPRS